MNKFFLERNGLEAKTFYQKHILYLKAQEKIGIYYFAATNVWSLKGL